MKILIVTETLNTGGAELFCLRLARALREKGNVVTIASLNRSEENSSMTGNFRDVPIQRFSIPWIGLVDCFDWFLRKLNIDFSLRYLLHAKALSRIAKDYNVIHSHYIQVDYMISRYRKWFPQKHLVTVHGDYSAQYDYYRKGLLKSWLNLDRKLQVLSKRVDRWVVISEEQRRFFEAVMKVPISKVKKVYNGYVRPKILPGRKAHVFTFGMIARGEPKKGWQTLINAFMDLPPQCRLILVGGGTYLEELRRKFSANTRMIFTGFQADIQPWLQEMDVFVLPTEYPFESLPFSVIEALSEGIPVIATDTGELGTMITDPESGKQAGLLLSLNAGKIDSNDLREKMMHLFNNPSLVNELATYARKASEKFDMKLCVEEYGRIYYELIRE